MTEKITLNHITKIEGHASLNLSIDKGKVRKCELSAEEGSRYFEGLLAGRAYNEASEISSRICGICSCSHALCAIQAIENTMKIRPSEQTLKLRELMAAGERIRSHAAHLYFLALPDYLGYESALSMVPKFRKDIERALRLSKAGNDLAFAVGGRSMHPVSATVDGFLKLPSKDDMAGLKKGLMAVRNDAAAAVKLFAKLRYPDFRRETEYFSIAHPSEYGFLRGEILSTSHKFSPHYYYRYMKEYHEPYSTSNFVVKKGKEYMVGALARMNNSFSLLSKGARGIAERFGLKFPSFNPFHNNIAQAIELVHCIDYAAELCGMKIEEENVVKCHLGQGHGVGVIEAPRGTLWHEYETNVHGTILKANLITPTCQNLRNMEIDIRDYVNQMLSRKKNIPREKIVLEIEKLIRAYDPCFSCSTHFLDVRWG